MRSFFHRAALVLAAVILIAILPRPALGVERGAVLLSAAAQSVSVDQGVQYLLEKPGEPLNAAQAMALPGWRAYEGRRFNLSFQPVPVWIRFEVRNTSAAREWVLDIPWALLDDIEFHRPQPDGRGWAPPLRAGFLWPLQTTAAKGPTYAFAVDLEPGQSTTLLLRVNASEYLVPLTLTQRPVFHAQLQDKNVWMGALFGVLGVMLLYNLSLSLFTRDRNYLAYSLYLLAVILLELTATGYGKLYLWTDSVWLNQRALPIFSTLTYWTALYFLRCFLDLQTHAPRLYRIYQGLAGIWVLMFIAPFLLSDMRPLFPISRAVGLSELVFLLGTPLYLAWRGHSAARTFAIAWATVVVANFGTVLWVLGVVEDNGLIENAQHIGFVVETVLLSVALAERIRRERLLKEAAQSSLLEATRQIEVERDRTIRAQQDLLLIERRNNEQLESRVQERTFELEQAMNNLAAANAELSELSITDGLTKAYNRRYFDEVLKAEHERATRKRLPLNLIMIDIDHFKRINDTVGHVGGDECLKLVAATLKSSVHRVDDLVARYGGEEFALILPSADPDAMQGIAEMLRRAVEAISFIYRGRQVPISISVGVLSEVPDEHRGVQDFIARADAALYEAKHSGRNCVKFAAERLRVGA